MKNHQRETREKVRAILEHMESLEIEAIELESCRIERTGDFQADLDRISREAIKSQSGEVLILGTKLEE